MTIQEKMGSIIKQLRIEHRLSQTELALKVGYTDKSAIAKIEAGKVDLPQSKIVAFANALGVTPYHLFGEDTNNIVTPFASPTTIAAHFDGEEFTEDELEEVRNFVDFVKNKRK